MADGVASLSRSRTMINNNEMGDDASLATMRSLSDEIHFMKGGDLLAYVRANRNRLSFPEKLMMMLVYIEKLYSKSREGQEKAPIRWLEGGQTFCIQDARKLCKQCIPTFFRGQVDMQKFVHTLKKWGFQRVQNNDSGEAPLTFIHEHFQRENFSLLRKLRPAVAPSSSSRGGGGVRRRRPQQTSGEQQQQRRRRNGLQQYTTSSRRNTPVALALGVAQSRLNSMHSTAASPLRPISEQLPRLVSQPEMSSLIQSQQAAALRPLQTVVKDRPIVSDESLSSSSQHDAAADANTPAVLERVIRELREKTEEHGPMHVAVAEAWNSLGLVRLHVQRDVARAFKCHEEALRIYQQLGSESPPASIAVTLNDLGQCHERSNDPDQALARYERSMSILQGVGASSSSIIYASTERALKRLRPLRRDV